MPKLRVLAALREDLDLPSNCLTLRVQGSSQPLLALEDTRLACDTDIHANKTLTHAHKISEKERIKSGK